MRCYLYAYTTILCYAFIFLSVTYQLLISSLEDDVIYAHSGKVIPVPVSLHNITLDGNINDTEWDDANRFNFSSVEARRNLLTEFNENGSKFSSRTGLNQTLLDNIGPFFSGAGQVVIYLKYDLKEKSLSGAFSIPDNTTILDVVDGDQIAFLFDVNHAGLNYTTSESQQIVFIRNTVSEYYKGNNTVPDDSATMIGVDDPYSSIELDSPFSRANYSIKSGDSNWQGEFKIFFRQTPDIMGFAIAQRDSYKLKNGTVAKGFINYPSVTSSQAYIPSTWADITFYDAISEENANSICQKTDRSINSDKTAILCLSLNRPSVDENDDKDSVIVNGTLANLLNGKGINDTVGYGIIDSGGNRQTETLEKQTDNGKFDLRAIPTSNLPSGTYKVFVKPHSSQYQGLESQSDLIVNPHVQTVQETVAQLGGYITVAANNHWSYKLSFRRLKAIIQVKCKGAIWPRNWIKFLKSLKLPIPDLLSL